ncbi:TolC family protein [Flavobacterium crassostreae]|uniref:Heavy metal resistance protein CzcC n=1 Tax=Flavobacterium crassostreae TaxID=1763534 RepID=A0A1B9DXI8_9FLAO|nr:TolC family protein [Flavobacterium crassostreae]OCB74402.1 heavy metal resistance protein CzcC [Flavobacterium crassostreae]
MQNIKKYLVICGLIWIGIPAKAQILTLDSIWKTIQNNNPQLQIHDAEIQSSNAAVRGAKTWMAPQLSTGFFMTPYNTQMWKANPMNPAMGAYMVGVTQMIPNSSRLKADANYLMAVASVEKENKKHTANQLYALAKTNYYQGLVLGKKIKIAKDNLLLLEYWIQSMEIRYQYTLGSLPTYYKAKSQVGALESVIIGLENSLSQKKILLHTLMATDIRTNFTIDTNYVFKDFNFLPADTVTLAQNRSDIQAIKKMKVINHLKTEIEKSKLLPEFGLKYDHMFAFGDGPQQFSLMGMITIPMPWSTKINKATIASIQIKNQSLEWQKQQILNETRGLLLGLKKEVTSLKKQYDIAQNKTIPALKKNYDTAMISWQNNTGALFAVLDAWESLNSAQTDSLDTLQAILSTQVEIEKQLETNNL